MSSNLISVHSQEEWDFVNNAIVSGFTDNIWIGGYQTSRRKVWTWDDKSTFVWTKWGENQPDGVGYCIYITWSYSQVYEWADAPCDKHSFPFVCRM